MKDVFVAVQTQYTAPMHAKILKILVKSGEKVNKGQGLLVIESMKMENRVCAASEGQVEVFVEEGEVCERAIYCKHLSVGASLHTFITGGRCWYSNGARGVISIDSSVR